MHIASKIKPDMISKYDIYRDTAHKGKLWVGSKDGKVWKSTEYFFENLAERWSK